ncbi:MAG: DUF2156 domain-containing protein [Deltaproteobacteria bacterium]|nr:DUF2156 domain-containing protein [Deltaproteobacteria bacterium]
MLEGIPEFPSFCEVTLDLAPALAPFLRSLSPEVSEFTFTNLYLFRAAHAYRVSRRAGLLLVTARGYDGTPYAFPPLGSGDVEEAALRLCEHLVGQGAAPLLSPVPSALARSVFGGPRWVVTPDRDQADYVYRRDDLAELPGKAYHKRKNRLAKLLREEAEGYAYGALGEDHVEDCLALAEGWCELRCSIERPSTFLETAATREALTCRDRLGLRGGVVLLGGRARAFCLGEELNPETFVVHFEKAELGREGLAQLINRDFCLRGLQGYRYVNREQDLGDPGLRQAKEAYHPAFLVEKCRVAPR